MIWNQIGSCIVFVCFVRFRVVSFCFVGLTNRVSKNRLAKKVNKKGLTKRVNKKGVNKNVNKKGLTKRVNKKG